MNAIERNRQSYHLFTGEYPVERHNWDFPSWDDIKAYTRGAILTAVPGGNPLAMQNEILANETRKALEANRGGVPLTDEEFEQVRKGVYTTSGEIAKESFQTHLIDPIANVFGFVKWILIAVIIIGAIILINKAT